MLQTKSDQALGVRLKTWVRPVLPPEVKPIEREILHILVVGEILSDGKYTDAQTASYVDVIVVP